MSGAAPGSPQEKPDPLDRWNQSDRWNQLRAPIVRALNLTPLVPPQSDDEIDGVVNDAWAGLHDIWKDREALVEVARAAQVFLEEHQRQKGAVLGEFDFLIYEEMETRLRDALSRLRK